MPDLAKLAGALAAGIACSFLWGRSLWYFDERSESFRRSVFFVIGLSQRKAGEVRSLLLTLIYCALGLLAATLFAVFFGLEVDSLISTAPSHVGIVILGIVGEISVANLLIDLSCRITGTGVERFREIEDVPWIKGVRQLPPKAAPVAAALGGVIEELFFRGVLMRILIERLMVPAIEAIAATGFLFCLQQIVQVRTVFQATIIGCGCVAISLVGGLLVVVSDSVLPALLSHASFVVFFMVRGSVSRNVGRAL